MKSYFYCLAGCPGQHPIFKPIFSCPQCHGLIDVGHDVDALRATTADEWKTRLQSRQVGPSVREQSGVWAHHEWVMPGIKEEEIVSMGEGRTPLTASARLADQYGIGGVYVKQCGQSLTGSFKDLGMTVLVSMANAMRERGEDIRALVCASTGDTSAALAAYGAKARIPVVVLLPKGKISTAQLVQPMANGAHVFALSGDFDQCMNVVQELVERPGIFLANSKNPLRIEGQKTVAFEIAAQLNWNVPDFVAVPSGNLGNVSALYQGFLLLRELGLTQSIPRLIACQVDAANPLFRAYEAGLESLDPVLAQDTHASAIRIGSPVSWPRAQKALRATNGMVTSIGETELLTVSNEMDHAGFFACPHTATAMGGIKALAHAGLIGKTDSVVVVSTAHGLKFSEQKVDFHEGRPFVPEMTMDPSLEGYRNIPEELPASLKHVEDALLRRLN